METTAHRGGERARGFATASPVRWLLAVLLAAPILIGGCCAAAGATVGKITASAITDASNARRVSIEDSSSRSSCRLV